MERRKAQQRARAGRRSRTPAVAALAAMLALAAPTLAEAKRARPAAPTEATAPREAGEPVMAIVSIAAQKVTVYDADGWIFRAPVSTGTTGRETPAGVFAVVEKDKDHRSTMYDDAWMPHMQRITWNGVALHGGPLPGYPASHGCVRMPYRFAENLFDKTRIGMRVIVAPNDPAPVEISHPLLFTPKPEAIAAAPARAETLGREAALAATAAADAAKAAKAAARELAPLKSALRKLERAKAQAEAALKSADRALDRLKPRDDKADQAKPDDSKTDNAKPDDAKTAEAKTADANTGDAKPGDAKPDDARSRAEQRREKAAQQAAEATAALDAARRDADAKRDAAAAAKDEAKAAETRKAATAKLATEARLALEPVSIYISRDTGMLYVRRNTRKPLPDGGELFDFSIELPVGIRDPDRPIGTHVFTAMARSDQGLRWSAVTIDGDDARAALDRITLPQEVWERIAPTAQPRSSIVISDEPLSKETNYRTEFVAVLSHQPQGGFVTRRPTAPVPVASRDDADDGGFGLFFPGAQQSYEPRRRGSPRDWW